MAHVALVHRMAGKFKKRLPPQVEMDDLVSLGYGGLIKAADRYDASMGQFDKYASSKIRGAMIDGLRKMDWAPRSVRRQARAIEQARDALRNRLGREVSVEEVAEETGLDPEDVALLDAEVHAAKSASLDEVSSMSQDGFNRHDYVTEGEESVEETAHLSHVARALLVVISAYDAREQLLLVLHYFEGISLAQIGEMLGISESRASQIHTRVVMDLREHMRGQLFD